MGSRTPLITISKTIKGSGSVDGVDFKIAVTDFRQTSDAKCRVLVVDDYPSMQQALVSCLDGLEVEVVGTAANGEEALRLVKSLHPQIVIADLQMPIMDGFQLTRELRRQCPEVNVIAVSGHYSHTIEKEALGAGAKIFISKVGLPQALIDAVQSLLA